MRHRSIRQYDNTSIAKMEFVISSMIICYCKSISQPAAVLSHGGLPWPGLPWPAYLGRDGGNRIPLIDENVSDNADDDLNQDRNTLVEF